MTRVLHVTHNMDFGGTEQVIRQIVLASNRSLYESSIVCVDGVVGEIGRAMRDEGITVTPISRGAGFDRQAIAKLRAHIKEHSIDVVHCHQYTPFCYGAIAALRLAVQVIFTEHGRFHPDRFTWKRRVVNQLFYRLADEITCISNATRMALDEFEWIPKKRIQVIYNGVAAVERPSDAQAIRRKLGIAQTALVLGTISRFDPIKNQIMMLDALSEIRKTHDDCVLIMAGDGPERAALESRVQELGISDHVHFTGFITDIAAHLNAIDFFLLTSFSEGTSMTLLEAMSVGKVVIATSVGGNVEVVENGVSGVLISSDDTAALVANVLRLSNDATEVQRLSEGAVAAYSQRFSVEQMVAGYENLYQRARSHQRHQ